MPPEASGPVISLMLAVPDAATATDWYKRALGATELQPLSKEKMLEIAHDEAIAEKFRP